MTFSNQFKDELGELSERSRERLIMGEYGEMSNRERAVRVYLAFVLAVPFVQLLVTSSPTAGRSVVALVSFGASFLIGWRAGYEVLHVGDREHVEDPDTDPIGDASAEESGSA